MYPRRVNDQTEAGWKRLSTEHGTGIYLTDDGVKHFISQTLYDDAMARARASGAVEFKWVPRSVAEEAEIRATRCGQQCTETCVEPGCTCDRRAGRCR